MKRLFTFGCSLTSYVWPTWADILGQEFDYFENWGFIGVGNQYIFNALVEATITKKITSQDTVMIMWTNFSRFDYYQERKWKTALFFKKNSKWESNDVLLDVLLDIRGMYVRDLALIHSAHLLLDNIGCNHKIFSIVDIDTVTFGPHEQVHNVQDLLAHYQPTLDRILPSVHREVFNFEWRNSRPIFGKLPRTDIHPTPAEHLEYLEKVLPEFPISQKTRDWVENCEAVVQQQPDVDRFVANNPNPYNIPNWNPIRIERW